MGTPRQQRVAAVILLSTLGMCALFLAQGATNLAGTALIDRSPVLGGAAPNQAAVPSRTTPASPRSDVDHEKVKLMLLGAAPDVSDGGVPDGSTGDGGFTETGPPRPCDGSAVLTASIVSWSRERSLAAITVNGTSRLYREGSVVDGKTVEEIQPHRAIMIIGTGRCYMAMFEPGAPAATPGATPEMAAAIEAATAVETATAEAENAGSGTITNEAMETGITRVSDRAFTVQRPFVDEIIRNQAEIMRTARVIPHEEDGRVVGVKMYGIRRNSVLGRLGVQNGDMLRTLNGFDLTSADSALDAYTRLSGASAFSLAVVRRGQPLTIDYTVQ